MPQRKRRQTNQLLHKLDMINISGQIDASVFALLTCLQESEAIGLSHLMM